MKKFFPSILVLLVFLSSISITIVKAADNPSMSIKLKNYIGNNNQLTITVKGEYDISGSSISLIEGKTYSVKVDTNGLSLYENNILVSHFTSITAIPKVYGTSNYITINTRPYLGTMKFVVENSSYVRPVNILPMEDYLKGVVPFEMMGSWNKEALKAQAVAARTYATRYTSKEIDDTISYQAYGGYEWYPNSTAAVEETKAQTLTYNGTMIDAVYSASNGGMTESNANVWGGTPLAIFPIKTDPYDTKIPWSFTLKKGQINTTSLDLANPQNWWTTAKEADTTLVSNIKNWLSQNGYANYEIKIISIPALSFSDNKTSGGRVQFGTINLQFFLKDKTTGLYVLDSNNKIKTNTLALTNTPASKIRAMIGLNVIKSYLVTSYKDDGTSYTVSGLGNGHGVGMSQWGAKVMADQGFNYRDILNFYYPGATLANTNPVPDVSPNVGTVVGSNMGTGTGTASGGIAPSTGSGTNPIVPAPISGPAANQNTGASAPAVGSNTNPNAILPADPTVAPADGSNGTATPLIGSDSNPVTDPVTGSDPNSGTVTPGFGSDSNAGTTAPVSGSDTNSGSTALIPGSDANSSTDAPIPGSDANAGTDAPIPGSDANSGTAATIPGLDANAGTDAPIPGTVAAFPGSSSGIAPPVTGSNASNLSAPVIGTEPKVKLPSIALVSSGYVAKDKQITLDYSIFEDGTASVYVKDSKGIKTYLAKNSSQKAGKQHFKLDVTKLPNGIYSFGIIITNHANLTSSVLKSVALNKTVLAPKVNSVSNRDLSVTGTAEAKATVTVKAGTKVLRSGVADSAGKFKITIAKQTAGTKLSITAKDTAGNVSKVTTITVLDKIAPAMPKVNTVTYLDTVVTGTTESKATVTIKIGSKVIGTAKADSKGKFSVRIPKQRVGTTLSAWSKDGAGNVSKAFVLKVKTRR